MIHFTVSLKRCLPRVLVLLVFASCAFPLQADLFATSPSILFFGPQKERDVAFDEGLTQIRKATEASVTYVASQGEFEGLMKKNLYDLVLCADQEICNQRSGELEVYIRAGNPVTTVATLDEGFETRLFVDVVDAPVLELRLPTIWEIIEWFECRAWCARTTPCLTQERRDCDQACNEAADKRARN